MKKLSEKTERNLTQGFGLLILFVIITFLAIVKNEKPEYTNPDSALSYIWDNMKESTEKIDIDSMSYIYASRLLDTQRVIQIIKFRDLMWEEEILATETKFGWEVDSITSEKEELIKFVYKNYY